MGPMRERDRLRTTAELRRTTACAVTFEVENVVRATQPLRECKTHEAIRRLIVGPIESCCDYSDNVVADVPHHPLMAAIHLAYAQHRPLILSPDMIWLTIAQGFAHHVANDAETLRPLLVSHFTKAVLRVERDDFIKGSPENPWPEVFEEFSRQIRQLANSHIHSMLACDFTTTGLVERAASEVVLMDVFRPYFDYQVKLVCGIPSVTLEGTVGDWCRLRDKATYLDGYGLNWWTRELLPICDQFVRAAGGDVDIAHWQGLYKLRHTYGSPGINGWICRLFPYLVGDPHGNVTKRNPLIGGDAEAPEASADSLGSQAESQMSITSRDLPTGLARVSVEWVSTAGTTPLEFVAGFVGITQDRTTLALRPKIGWAVRQNSGIEDVLSRIQHQHILNPPCSEKKQLNVHAERFPGVLAQFYDACDGARLFRVGGTFRYRIVGRSELRPPNLLSSRSSSAKLFPQWLRFCVLDDGSFYAISLRDPACSVWHWPNDSPSRDQHLTKVAGSILEFLSLLLDSGGRYIHESMDGVEFPGEGPTQ